MTLLDEIQAKVAPVTLASQDVGAIHAEFNVGRVKSNTLEIGNGTILEILGITAGNALLDVINSNPSFRYVKPLVEQGRLLIGSALVQGTIKSLVPAVLTQAQADALCAKGMSPNPASIQEVAVALIDDTGAWRI